MKSWIKTVSAEILEMWKKHIMKCLNVWDLHKQEVCRMAGSLSDEKKKRYAGGGKT